MSNRRTKTELRRLIESGTTEYSPEEIFSDPALCEVLRSIVIGACDKRKVHPVLSVFCNPYDNFTAATNGTNIRQNSLSPLIRELPTNWEKYVANVGHTVHEVGHILFTCFDELNTAIDFWRGCSATDYLYPKGNEEDEEKVRTYFKDRPETRALYASLMRNIENTLEDAYIENLLKLEYSGVAVQGLCLVNKEIYRKMETKKEIIENVLSNNLPPICIAEALLLSRYVCLEELEDGDLDDEEKKVLSFVEGVLKTAEDDIEELLWEQDGIKRCRLYNSLYIKFLPLFPLPENEENSEGKNKGENGDENSNGNSGEGKGGSNSGSSKEGSSEGVSGTSLGTGTSSGSDLKPGSGDISVDEKTRVEEYISVRNKEIGKSERPESSTEPRGGKRRIGKKEKEEVKEKTERGKNAGEVNGSLALDKAIKAAVKERVMQDDEIDHQVDLVSEANEIYALAARTRECALFSGYKLRRKKNVSIEEDIAYRKILSKVRKNADNLLRRINNVMREREVESLSSGFMMGQRFNAKDIVNRDGKYFSRQIEPDGKITTAFGILIDESGSMKQNKKFVRAREVAIMLEYVLRNLGVSHIICGHNTEGYGQSAIDIFADFDTRDGKDNVRLAGLTTGGGNIDGAAITYIGEKLLKRPEKRKVLIVISDGLPVGRSFYATDSDKDTALAANYYRKKGIDVFGAIVDDAKTVMEIYGPEYCFDCTKDGELEKQLVKLIKKYVLMRK